MIVSSVDSQRKHPHLKCNWMMVLERTEKKTKIKLRGDPRFSHYKTQTELKATERSNMLRAKESTKCGNMMIMASSDFISNNFNGVTRTETRL